MFVEDSSRPGAAHQACPLLCPPALPLIRGSLFALVHPFQEGCLQCWPCWSCRSLFCSTESAPFLSFGGTKVATKLKKSVYQAVIQSVIKCKSVELRPGNLTQVKFFFKNCPKVIIIKSLGIDGDKKWSPFQDSGVPSPFFCTKKNGHLNITLGQVLGNFLKLLILGSFLAAFPSEKFTRIKDRCIH